MELSTQMLLIICPLIFLAGFVDSIAGGGGLISLPAYMLAGLPPHMAIATNKFSACIGTSISARRMLSHMDPVLTGLSVAAALLGSSVGSNLALLASGKLLEYMLLPVLIVVAYYVLRNKNLGQKAETDPLPRRKTLLLSVLISLVVGVYDGFYGPGTGTFLILLYTGIVHMNTLDAAANGKGVNLASNVGAAVVFILNGQVFYKLGIIAAVFSVLGNYFGAGLVLKNGSKIVRPIILIVLGILFVKIIFL